MNYRALLIAVLSGLFAPLTDAQIYLPRVTSAALAGGPTYAPGGSVVVDFGIAAAGNPAKEVDFVFSTADGYSRTATSLNPAAGVASLAVDAEWPSGNYRLTSILVVDALGILTDYRTDGSIQSMNYSWITPAPGPTPDLSGLGFTVTGGLDTVTAPALLTFTRTSPDTLVAGNPATYAFSLRPGSSSAWSVTLRLRLGSGATFVGQTLTNVTAGTFSFPTGTDWTNGVYQAGLLIVSDANSYAAHLRSGSAEPLLVAADFQLTGGASSIVYPQISSVSRASAAAVGPGQTVSLGFAVAAGTSRVASATFTYTGLGSYTKSITADVTNGTATAAVSDGWLDGPYSLSTISVADTLGRTTTYSRNGSVAQQPSGAGGVHSLNFAALDFQVGGAVSVAPFILRQPQGGTVQPGNTLELSISVGSPAGATCQWYIGQPGDTAHPVDPTMLVSYYTPPPPSSTTTYWVRATNAYGSVDSAGATLTVAYPSDHPTIVTQPQSIYNGPATYLSVLAVGPPPLTYQWFKDGAALAGATQPQLNLNPTSYLENGAYAVTVTNPNGSVGSATVTVRFEDGVQILAQPVSQTVAVGGTATFTISATGGNLSYSWGGPIDITDAMGNGTPTITLPNVQQNYAGTYSVWVGNSTGNVKSSGAVLTVTGGPPPVITVAPTAYGQVGQVFFLRVSATNYPTHFSASGLPAGLGIGEDGGISGTPTASGTFATTVSATNVGGTSTASLSIVISPGPYAPIITQQPQSQTAVLHSPVTFSAAASGTAQPGFSLDFQWYFNGQQISGATASTYTVSVDSTAAAGDYTVVVRGSAGATGSAVAHLTVDATRSAPFLPGGLNLPDVSVAAGDAVTLAVAASGTGPLSYQWAHEYAPLPGATGPTYTIHNASAAELGRYNVKITNAYGSVATNPNKVDVIYTVQPASPTIAAGATATLSVPASDATVSYQWYAGSRGDILNPVQGATGPTFTTAPLNATASYWVSVQALWPGGGVFSTAAVVTVAGAPIITTPPSPQTVNAGSTATLSVTAVGAGLAYQWQKNGAALSGANSSTLVLANVQAADAGNYSVIVSNASGSAASPAVALTVVGGPGAPAITTQPVSQTINRGGSVVFSVATDGSGKVSAQLSGPVRSAANAPATTYQWLLNGVPIAGATEVRLVVSNATAANAGVYTCTATTAGVSTVSDPAVLTVASTADPGRLVNLSVQTLAGPGAQTVTVGWVSGGAGTSGSQTLLIRACGPALTAFGVLGVLADPTLTVFSGPTAVAGNDNWGSAADNRAAVAAAESAVFAFPLADPSSLDAALVATLPANSGYTAQISGVAGSSGRMLAEIYDDTPGGTYTPASPRLVNLSCQANLPAGGMVTAGFVVGGSTARTLLIRATGPALVGWGVSGAMADPRITLHATVAGRDAVLASNAGWGGDPQITAVGNSVYAFPLTDAASADSVILVTLAPGSYTVQGSSASGAPGISLVEIYEVP